MAVIAEVTMRGVNEQQYDAIRERTGWLEHAPDGGLAHLTWWEGADCHSLDGWESEAAFGAFGEQRLGPALAALGVTAPPEVTFHAAHEVYSPRRSVVTATSGPEPGTDNVALVRGGYEAFAAGDIPRVLAFFDADLVWTSPDSIRGGGRYTGPQGAAEFFGTLPGNYADLDVRPDTFIDGGDSIAVLGTHSGHTVAGTEFRIPFVHVWTLRDGKATSFTEYFDTAPLLHDLGTGAARTTAPSDAPAMPSTAAAGTATVFDAEATLRRMFDEVINQGRLEVADELFAEDFVDHGPMGDMPGRETFKQLIARWRAAVPDVHCEIDTVIVDGERCAWMVRTTGTHTGDGLGFPATNKPFRTVSANLGLFREGKAVEHWSEQGMFPMLLQLGLIPMGAPVAG
jgi:ketosteroid isomerase-like protein